MKGLCTITPCRGDREELTAFCVDRMPLDGYLINYKPQSDELDLVPRIKEGIRLAKDAGYEYIFIMENDDFYSKGFFETLDFTGYDFFGYEYTHYYNLKNRTYQTMWHKNRSSLFCTGFKISAMDKFPWPADHTVFFDIKLWEYAMWGNFKVKLETENPLLGIKHGIGKCAGKAHRMELENHDPNLEWLKGFVDKEAFNFYTDLMTRI